MVVVPKSVEFLLLAVFGSGASMKAPVTELLRLRFVIAVNGLLMVSSLPL